MLQFQASSKKNETNLGTMLRLFRQIRKKLMEQNKVRTYLLYAFGEIALVMIGILLALQVNNWNEMRKDTDQLNAILLEVHEDLKTDQNVLSRDKNFYLSFSNNLKTLIGRGTQLPNDSLAFRISNMHRIIDFTAQSFGYKKLNDNPNTQRLSSELIAPLTNYYSTFGAGNISNTNSDELSVYSLNLYREYLLEYGFPISELTLEAPKDLSVFSEIIRDPKFIGIIRNMIYNWDIYKIGLDEAELLVLKNIELLENYFSENDLKFNSSDR